eukprot:XP_014062842.1 PREDICTED: protein Shroom4-like [Salmo salar]
MEIVEQLVSFNHILVQLNGGTPWGFTLKGGLEHGEPLIITKIEEGGKAEQCKKLRVGDELVNINGSALYGSRQEAVILIKGSYRILKITVRRRSVPVIRPHSWHLSKLSSTESPHSSTPVPPPTPPSPPSAMQLHPGPYTLPWHSTADNSDLSIQWNQLSRHYSTDRSSSLGSMDSLDPPSSQVYYDSHNSPVDPAIFNNKRDYDYHNSPVDPAIFNNKRDSAYSSFSASSNMSDNTVSLRPGEACSMENILRSLGPGGPACRVYACGNAPSLGRESGEAQDETGTSALLPKSRSLTRPRVRQPEAKERPSSYCFEEERREERREERGGGGGKRGASIPPLPPTRKDSFRSTKGRLGITDVKDQRCISAPVGIPSLFRCHAEDDDDNPQNVPGVPVIPSWNVYPAPCKASKAEGDMGNGKRNGVGNFKGDSLEQYYTLISKKKDSLVNKNSEIQEIHPDSLHLPALERSSSSSIPGSSSLPPDSSIDPDPSGEANHLLPQNKHCSSGLYKQSVPEKLLSQLRHLEFSSDPSDHSSVSPSSSKWSHSPLNPPREDLGGDIGSHDASLLLLQQNQWEWEGRSPCSTPGLVDIDGIGEAGEVSVVVWESREVVAAAGNLLSPIQVQYPWGRPVSVPGPGEPSGNCTQGEVSSERVWETDFGPLSAAASVDSLLEGSLRGGGGRRDDNEGEVLMKKPRSHRSSRARRRSERFATNLRNEIQHKKAQLSKSKGPGGLLYSGETVEEEEDPALEIKDLQRKEAEDLDPPAKESSSQGVYTCSDISLSAPAPGGLNRLSSSSTLQLHQLSLATVSALQPPRDKEPEPPGNQDQATDSSRTPQKSDPTLPSCGMGIQVVEELAPAGKSRRWRWTPEHKLQPEIGTNRRGERVGVALGVSGRGRASSASSSSSNTCSSHTEESDILPFADRCKFFEETSRSILVSNLPGLTSRRQRPDRHERQPHLSMLENQGGGYGQGQAQRRYSYQGGFERESPLLISTMEARRQSVSGNREREKEREREEREKEREMEREEREREREREREERATERERLLEREEMGGRETKRGKG